MERVRTLKAVGSWFLLSGFPSFWFSESCFQERRRRSSYQPGVAPQALPRVREWSGFQPWKRLDHGFCSLAFPVSGFPRAASRNAAGVPAMSRGCATGAAPGEGMERFPTLEAVGSWFLLSGFPSFWFSQSCFQERRRRSSYQPGVAPQALPRVREWSGFQPWKRLDHGFCSLAFPVSGFPRAASRNAAGVPAISPGCATGATPGEGMERFPTLEAVGSWFLLSGFPSFWFSESCFQHFRFPL